MYEVGLVQVGADAVLAQRHFVEIQQPEIAGAEQREVAGAPPMGSDHMAQADRYRHAVAAVNLQQHLLPRPVRPAPGPTRC